MHCQAENEKRGKPQNCEHLDLKSIKQRCKRYTSKNDHHASKVKLHIFSCDVHGKVDQEKSLCKLDTTHKFISFLCFLIQFKFKVLSIEDINQTVKDIQREELVNLLLLMLETCEPQYYYFPIRALAEFYTIEISEKSLGKRIISESLLKYKIQKEFTGRHMMLVDFKKSVDLNLISQFQNLHLSHN